MRWLSLALIALVVLLQYPLWIGKGGWLRVWDVDRQLQQQREANARLEVRNAGLDAEVRDLKQGYDAIEERARYELGMIRQDEVFVQIPEKAVADSAATTTLATPATPTTPTSHLPPPGTAARPVP
jgi:cell division protein FtsB